MSGHSYSLDKVYAVLKKVKDLKKNEKNLKALTLLEDLLRNSKKKYYLEAGKITGKALGICVRILDKGCVKVQILKRADSVIATFFGICTKRNLSIPEKNIQRILQCFNYWMLFHRTCNNFSMVFTYERKVATLVKNRQSNAETFEMLSKFYLNIGSVCLEVKNFKDAIRFVEEALKCLQDVVSVKGGEGEEGKVKERCKEVALAYMLSFYCIFVAQDRLGQKDLALDALKNAAGIGRKSIGSDKNEIYAMVVRRLETLPKPGMQLNEKCLFHLNLSQSLNTVEFFDKDKTVMRTREQKLPGRYYTKTQLESKQKLLRNQSQLNFISADQFFFQEISKSINIKSDIKHIKLSQQPTPKNWICQENLERRRISELRLKKKFRSTTSSSPVPAASDRFKNLKLSEHNSQVLISEKIQSLLSSSRFKEIIDRICSFNKAQKVFPTQKLFFKPKNSDRIETPLDLEVKSVISSQRRRSVYESTRDEIADLMDTINKEIHLLYTERDNSKLATPSICGSVKSLRESSLCKSTSKCGKASDHSLALLKSSIHTTFATKRRRPQKKPSALLDLQV